MACLCTSPRQGKRNHLVRPIKLVHTVGVESADRLVRPESVYWNERHE